MRVHNILDSVRAEVAELEADGANIIIASGDADFNTDVQIAKLDGIDVVVSGAEIFMYTGTQPGLLSSSEGNRKSGSRDVYRGESRQCFMGVF